MKPCVPNNRRVITAFIVAISLAIVDRLFQPNNAIFTLIWCEIHATQIIRLCRADDSKRISHSLGLSFKWNPSMSFYKWRAHARIWTEVLTTVYQWVLPECPLSFLWWGFQWPSRSFTSDPKTKRSSIRQASFQWRSITPSPLFPFRWPQSNKAPCEQQAHLIHNSKRWKMTENRVNTNRLLSQMHRLMMT